MALSERSLYTSMHVYNLEISLGFIQQVRPCFMKIQRLSGFLGMDQHQDELQSVKLINNMTWFKTWSLDVNLYFSYSAKQLSISNSVFKKYCVYQTVEFCVLGISLDITLRATPFPLSLCSLLCLDQYLACLFLPLCTAPHFFSAILNDKFSFLRTIFPSAEQNDLGTHPLSKTNSLL